jgi:HEAT repeat protein
MNATGAQIARLQAALVTAYDYAGLRQMLRTQLEENVEAIAPVTDANLKDIAYAVIRHYAAQPGGLHRLIRAARSGNPGNPALAAVADELLAQDFQPDIATEADYREAVVARYNRLGLTGLGEVDLRLSDIALEDVFVRLSMTVEKVVPQQTPPDEHKQAPPDEHKQTPPDEHKQSPSSLHRQEQRLQSSGRRDKKGDQGRLKDKDESKQQRQQIIVVQEPITLTAALAQNALIVGEPGSGKSTLLRWLAVTFAAGRQQDVDRLGAQADADRLPLLVELGRLPERFLQTDSRETPNWEKFLPEHIAAQPSFHAIPAPLLAEALTQGRGLLLCDGLDEIADLAARRRIADSLAEYARSSANRLVLSSRPAGVSGSEGALGGRFQRITIQRFKPEDVQRFFRFWYALDTRLAPTEQTRQADALFAKVQAAPKTLGLAGTPLLATLLLLIWRNEGDLPERRDELYERCCRMLIEHWEAHHDVAYTDELRYIGWEVHRRLLAPLAYTIHSTGQRTDAPMAELAPVLAAALQAEGLAGANANLKAEKYLRTLSLRSGLLQFLGNDRYGFPHLTFQEYLTARHIAGQPDPDYIDLVMAHLHEAWWQEVHLLVIGHLASVNDYAEQASQLILSILNRYRPPWKILRSQLRQKRKTPAKVIRLLAEAVDWQWERRVAWVLSRELSCVMNGLRDNSNLHLSANAQRELTLRSAEIDGDNRFFKPTFEESCHSKRTGTVGYHEQPARPQSLNQWLMDDAENRALTKAFGAYMEPMMSRATNNSRWVARQLAYELGQKYQAPAEAISELETLLYQPSRFIHTQNSSTSTRSLAALRILVQALDDPNPDTRKLAISVLGEVRNAPEFVITALSIACKDTAPDVREQAVSSLGLLGRSNPNSEITEAMVRAMGDSHSVVRQKAVKSMATLRIQSESLGQIIRVLNRRLHDSEEDVRQAALESIQILLDGRPIPGYRWVPLRQRRDRARRRRIAGYWVLGITTVLLLAWLAAVVTTQIVVDPFVERFVAALLALVALAAGAVQVLAWFRRPFWDR